MKWRILVALALASLAVLIFLFGMVNTLVWLLPGAEKLWHIEVLMASIHQAPTNGDEGTIAAMKTFFILVQLVMSFVMAGLPAAVAWLLWRNDRKYALAKAADENRRAEWGDAALSWWIGQLMHSAGDPKAREETIRKGISQFLPALTPGHRTWMQEVVTRLGVDAGANTSFAQENEEWQLSEPWLTVMMLGSFALAAFLFLLGILNAVALSWLGGFPGLDLPSSPALITLQLGEFSSLSSAFAVFALGIFLHRKSASNHTEKNRENRRLVCLEGIAGSLVSRLQPIRESWNELASAMAVATLKGLTVASQRRLLEQLRDSGYLSGPAPLDLRGVELPGVEHETK